MKSDQINALLQRASYSALNDDAIEAITQVLGASWLAWADDVARFGKESPRWSDLRSVLMAVNAQTTLVLGKLCLDTTLAERVVVFQREGKPLRDAVAALQKEPANAIAVTFVIKAFAAYVSKQDRAIESRVHHIYGSTNAVTFEHARSRGGRACLQVEAASRPSRAHGFDWQRKIIVQLSDTEALQVLSVLRGWLETFEAQHHGPARDKRMTIRRQDGGAGGFLVSVRQPNEARVVPMPVFDAFKVTAMILRIMAENEPHLTPEMVSDMARELALQAQAPNTDVSGGAT